ncbi:MAG TPA: type II toxin-antitoxin system VapC family toxin [Gemmatimonadaceae bacterium]
MILVDTSVWVHHLRAGEPLLAALLLDEQVLLHPFVLGELACGTLRHRRTILDLLDHLPRAPVCSAVEELAFIEQRALMGRGIGYIDAHLLASAALAGTAQLWTRDRRLAEAAVRLKLAFDPDR